MCVGSARGLVTREGLSAAEAFRCLKLQLDLKLVPLASFLKRT